MTKMQARHTLSGQNKQKTNSETAKLYKERNKKKWWELDYNLLRMGTENYIYLDWYKKCRVSTKKADCFSCIESSEIEEI